MCGCTSIGITIIKIRGSHGLRIFSIKKTRLPHHNVNRWPGAKGAWPSHDGVIKWKHFPLYWPLVRGIHRSPMNSPHKGQWRGALMFSFICAWINGWINRGWLLRRHCAHCDVTIMATTLMTRLWTYCHLNQTAPHTYSMAAIKLRIYILHLHSGEVGNSLTFLQLAEAPLNNNHITYHFMQMWLLIHVLSSVLVHLIHIDRRDPEMSFSK